MEIDKELISSLEKYEFLSREWFEEFKATFAKLGIDLLEVPVAIRMNQLVKGAPFQEEPVKAYLTTESGKLELGLGELKSPDLTVSLDYDTAKAMFVDLDPQKALEAFFQGRIIVTGDMTKLVLLAQALGSRDESDPVATVLKAITS
jgi:hypothetical protein